jgi:hypothetical protein
LITTGIHNDSKPIAIIQLAKQNKMFKDKIKKEFILNEIWTLTIAGGFGRATVYENSSGEASQRLSFRTSLRSHLDKVIKEEYSKNQVTDERHLENIVELCQLLTKKHGEILSEKTFRLGMGQKVFNLYLKYLWCIGEIAEPPHCPFDSIIIAKLSKENRNVKWTQMTDKATYEKLVKSAKVESSKVGKSIAEWELSMWNDEKASTS